MVSKILVGVDEAGRGPIIGPLVMAAAAIREEDLKKLQYLGVKDSKLLSKEAREEMFERLHEILLDFRIELIEPDAVDSALGDPTSNLNWLEAETSARLVSQLNPSIVYVDCPSRNIQAYTDYFKNKLSAGVAEACEIVMEHKADENYPIAAAASILAKVIRDRAIEHLKTEIGEDFGSGYLGDEKTRKFLEKNYEKYPDIFRKSWKPYADLVEDKRQRRLGEF
ncbi:ribonuclease HII [archaeon]|nr:ribonuclease HII [archaeon]|tara:strand:+ start:4676 stop:5347 length:672 start_codon:yes stop_codon:yes gene_type:complete